MYDNRNIFINFENGLGIKNLFNFFGKNNNFKSNFLKNGFSDKLKFYENERNKNGFNKLSINNFTYSHIHLQLHKHKTVIIMKKLNITLMQQV